MTRPLSVDPFLGARQLSILVTPTSIPDTDLASSRSLSSKQLRAITTSLGGALATRKSDPSRLMSAVDKIGLGVAAMTGRQPLETAMMQILSAQAQSVDRDIELAKGDVQDYLARNGFLTGKPSGRFDRDTMKAIEKMQKFYGLAETGSLDPLTVMLITSRQKPTRPRLFSTEG